MEQIPVGRGNKAELAALPRIAADALIGAFLHDAQKLRLQGERQFADLIEKQRSAVRVRKCAVACSRPRR